MLNNRLGLRHAARTANLLEVERRVHTAGAFELAVRIDPHYVDAWVKKGYAHFH